MTQNRRIKGSVVLDMVKVIRAFKDLPWDRYLKPEDFEIVKTMVIPTAWYPIETYQRMGLAVYKLVAKESEDVVRKFGQAAMKELLEGPYRPFLVKNDPFEAVAKFFELRKSLFTFSKMAIEKTGDKSLRARITEFGDFSDGLDVFTILLCAHLEELAKNNGCKGITLKPCHEKEKGQTNIVVDMAWT
ncbi:MAG TPA: hypothetical protein VM658_14295 [bacterium]|nr:hypothetical protein [bacterium]